MQFASQMKYAAHMKEKFYFIFLQKIFHTKYFIALAISFKIRYNVFMKENKILELAKDFTTEIINFCKGRHYGVKSHIRAKGLSRNVCCV